MSAFRVAYHPEAFSISLGKKRPREENGKHLAFIRSLPCVVCGTRAKIEAAHIRAASLPHGKRGTGTLQKSDDRWTRSRCSSHHAEQHAGNELAFWASKNIDPFVTASALWGCTGDDEAAETVIRHARRVP